MRSSISLPLFKAGDVKGEVAVEAVVFAAHGFDLDMWARLWVSVILDLGGVR